METSIAYNNTTTAHQEMMVSLAVKAKNTVMKKLTNVSPFLLLLVPVFVMILLVFTVDHTGTTSEEAAMKAAVSKTTVAKVDNTINK